VEKTLSVINQNKVIQLVIYSALIILGLRK